MNRPGRPSPERERQIKSTILALVSEEKPGMTFKQLVEAAKVVGIPKPTLWRHLTRFVKLRLVTHEGKFYRRDPLFADELLGFKMRTPLIQVNAAGFMSMKGGAYSPDMLRSSGFDAWAHKPFDMSKSGIPNAEAFYLSLQRILMTAINEYLALLAILPSASSLAAAGEIANLFLDGRVTPWLMIFARRVWEHRNTSFIESLDGRELQFKVTVKHRS